MSAMGFQIDAFLISGLFEMVMLIGIALLLHVQLGVTRIANFGVVGFWGVGLYTYGVLYIKVDWPFEDPWVFLICVAAATVSSGVCGLAVGWLIADLNTDGVLIGTLGFATIVAILATTEKDLTGGAQGLGGMRFPYDTGDIATNELVWLVVMIVVCAFIYLWVSRLHRTPYGRLLIATGDNEPLATRLGKNSTRTKLEIFALTSAGMGLLGALYGVMTKFLEIGSLGVELTLAVFVGLVLGGTARPMGAVVGVVLTVGLFNIVLQGYVPLPVEWYTQTVPVVREMLFGALLIVVLMFRPSGLLGRMNRVPLMKKVHSE